MRNRGDKIQAKEYKIYTIITHHKEVWELLNKLRPYIDYSITSEYYDSYMKTKEKDFNRSLYIERLIKEELKNNKNQKREKKPKRSSITINPKLLNDFKEYCKKRRKKISEYLDYLVIQDLRKGTIISKDKLKLVIEKKMPSLSKEQKENLIKQLAL